MCNGVNEVTSNKMATNCKHLKQLEIYGAEVDTDFWAKLCQFGKLEVLIMRGMDIDGGLSTKSFDSNDLSKARISASIYMALIQCAPHLKAVKMQKDRIRFSGTWDEATADIWKERAKHLGIEIREYEGFF